MNTSGSFYRQKNSTKVPIEIIQNIVSSSAGMTVEMMNGKTRKREICDARKLSMKLCYDLSGGTLKSIGSSHGKRDHTTVIHAKRTIDWLIEVHNPDILNIYKPSMTRLNTWLAEHPDQDTKKKAIKEEKVSVQAAVGILCFD